MCFIEESGNDLIQQFNLINSEWHSSIVMFFVICLTYKSTSSLAGMYLHVYMFLLQMYNTFNISMYV